MIHTKQPWISPGESGYQDRKYYTSRADGLNYSVQLSVCNELTWPTYGVADMTQCETIFAIPVSYTHLDVYKRQV